MGRWESGWVDGLMKSWVGACLGDGFLEVSAHRDMMQQQAAKLDIKYDILDILHFQTS